MSHACARQPFLLRVMLVSFLLPYASCKAADEYEEGDKSETQAVKDEPEGDYLPKLGGWGALGGLPPYPFAPALKGGSIIDIRGFGDTSWAIDAQAIPEERGMAEALRAFNRDGSLLRSDLTFINFESAVGRGCGKWSHSEFKFISHPQAVVDFIKAGAKLIGLANNHSEDCDKSEFSNQKLNLETESNTVAGEANDALAGAQQTAGELAEIKKQWPEMMWHGVSKQKNSSFDPAIQTHYIRKIPVRVAFASVFVGWDCEFGACEDRVKRIMEKMRDSQASLKILAIHSQPWSKDKNPKNAVQRQRDFAKDFIKNYDGDVVWAHGPHTWAGVEAVLGTAHKVGVVFYSLGNFLHPSLREQKENLMGRILWDVALRRPVQVQAIPLATRGSTARLYEVPAAIPPKSNMNWQKATLSVDGKKAQVLYSNAPSL